MMKLNPLAEAHIIHLETPESIWEHLTLTRTIQYFWLGRQPYVPVWELQKQLHNKRVSGELLFLVPI